MAGKAPRNNGQRPIMALLDLLSQRWALRLLWELRDGARTSRDLREATAISPTVLQSRLDELRAAGIAELARGSGYRLRSEEHTSELQSLMRISYAVLCLTKTKKRKKENT